METKIVLTGILKDHDLFLVVQRSHDDDLFPGAWEFPGGHLEEGETLKQGLMRELKEEIGFEGTFEPIITHYTDEITENKNCFIHEIEIDFVIPVEKEKVQVKLSDEHIDFKWVKKDSPLLDDFIRAKLINL